MKKLTLTLCIVAILGSAASAYFYIQIGNSKQVLQDELDAKTAQSTSLTADLAASKEQASNLQQRLTSLDSELGDAKSRLSSSEARSVQINRDLTQVRSQLTAKEQAEKEASAQVDQLRSELVKARLNTEQGSPEEVEKLKQNVATLEARIQELQSQGSSSAIASSNTTPAMSMGTASSTGEVSAMPASSTKLAADFSIKVASVGPQSSFVVLSFGKNDGAQAGQSFFIVRNGEEVARAQISEVRDGYAIAQVSPASIKSALRAGDSATVSAPRS